jgi:response regulator RpfG family c-di-GMP phosphodiesterase
MKTRILFVDDETLVLEGLQRMLRSMRAEWDMVFVGSGAKALELMAQNPFDVVISDMRMPGMNGAEFLAEVLKRFPKTVRLILSGHADRDLVLKCVGTTHQYLSKPCQPDELKAAVMRASNLELSLRDQSLRQLVSRLDRLPSIPALYVQIVEKLQDPDIGVDEIGSIVAKDLAMTAKILKLVNSAFFGLGHQISSPGEAVSYLGMETIKSLVLSVHAFSQFSSAKLGQFSIDALWIHSQQTAGLAKEIARMEDSEHKLLDDCFVAGLLHDTGKLVLASNFPSQYDQVLEMDRSGQLPLLAAGKGIRSKPCRCRRLPAWLVGIAGPGRRGHCFASSALQLSLPALQSPDRGPCRQRSSQFPPSRSAKSFHRRIGLEVLGHAGPGGAPGALARGRLGQSSTSTNLIHELENPFC